MVWVVASGPRLEPDVVELSILRRGTSVLCDMAIEERRNGGCRHIVFQSKMKQPMSLVGESGGGVGGKRRPCRLAGGLFL